MARLNPDLVRLISASGHELAGHSYSHRHMTDLTETEVEDEILRTEVAVREIVDQQIHYFRPPGGHYDARVKRAVENLGYRAVFWGPNIRSFTDLKPDETARELLKRVTPGCILLLHNGEDQTIPVLPKLLAGLKKSGFEMVTLTELLNSGKPIKRKLKWE